MKLLWFFLRFFCLALLFSTSSQRMIVNRRSALAPDPREGRDVDQPRPGPPAPGGSSSTRP
ncbi:hypothetical protein POPTR_015G034150v4 [Populus trichocarpa]|uniref:Uncharacterized protein n=1 Tax=Populus trichocarpa TaxID=3694 RepID=A0A3N7G026_POPTR|nr:hypothetical protein BDE02_15G030200 [Populus trichocarpa]RQP00544.1 hypothetical protein POPTR_015G034150v4 [Populus trichocarpa]